MKSIIFLLLLFNFVLIVFSQDMTPATRSSDSKSDKSEDEYVIRRPGEITFMTGIVIEGRVEKPQVMLVLTKEKIKLEPISFRNTFLKNITNPLRYNTFELFTEKKEKKKAIKRKIRRNQ